MTKEDQDAEVGRLVRERRDLRAHHQALVSRAQAVGKLLSGIGKAGSHNTWTPAAAIIDAHS